jgi:hypothetical protein
MTAVLARVGVERIEADVPPTNAPSLGVLYSQQFLVTSMLTSERWGTCLHLTKFLHPGAEATFARQYCALDAGRPSREPPNKEERSTP